MSFSAEGAGEKVQKEIDLPVVCSTPNCHFYGRPSTNNLCSQCYKEHLKEQQQQEKAGSDKILVKKTSSLGSEGVKSVVKQANLQAGSFMGTESESLKRDVKEVHEEGFITPKKKEKKAEEEDEDSNVTAVLDKVEESLEKEDAAFEVEKKEDVVQRVQKDTRRCMECNKFIGFTGIKCKCGFVYCGKHRYPEDHVCDFDFEQMAKERFMQGRHKAAVADKISGERL